MLDLLVNPKIILIFSLFSVKCIKILKFPALNFIIER